MKRYSILLALVCLLSGCATRPENIAPSYISEMTYRNWDCDQLAQEQPRLSSALASACDAQQTASGKDAAGVFFLGVPVASLSGEDRAYEVARLKGELQALQREAILKNCNLPPVPEWKPAPPQQVELPSGGR